MGFSVLVRIRRIRATGNKLRTRGTSGTAAERKPLDENCVENGDQTEAPAADHHTVDGGWSHLHIFTLQTHT